MPLDQHETHTASSILFRHLLGMLQTSLHLHILYGLEGSHINKMTKHFASLWHEHVESVKCWLYANLTPIPLRLLTETIPF